MPSWPQRLPGRTRTRFVRRILHSSIEWLVRTQIRFRINAASDPYISHAFSGSIELEQCSTKGRECFHRVSLFEIQRHLLMSPNSLASGFCRTSDDLSLNAGKRDLTLKVALLWRASTSSARFPLMFLTVSWPPNTSRTRGQAGPLTRVAVVGGVTFSRRHRSTKDTKHPGSSDNTLFSCHSWLTSCLSTLPGNYQQDDHPCFEFCCRPWLFS